MNLESIYSLIQDYKDFPKEGIVFKDISPVLANAEAFEYVIDQMCEKVSGIEFEKIVAIDARGFLFGSAMAYKLNKGLILCRKKGKLPGEVISKSYSYEYASSELSIQENLLEKDQKYLIVDDVLATGNTAMAVNDIVVSANSTVSGILFFAEIDFLEGRKLLHTKNVNSISLLNL